jgi:hypothetical protein
MFILLRGKYTDEFLFSQESCSVVFFSLGHSHCLHFISVNPLPLYGSSFQHHEMGRFYTGITDGLILEGLPQRQVSRVGVGAVILGLPARQYPAGAQVHRIVGELRLMVVSVRLAEHIAHAVVGVAFHLLARGANQGHARQPSLAVGFLWRK